MVLQRDKPIHVWGWSEANEKVTVAFNETTGSATADGYGRWSVYLPPEPAGGPFTLKISGKNQLVLEDVLVGDVWFASGQSNMEMPLKGFPGAAIKNGAEEISHANERQIRLLMVGRKASAVPFVDVPTERAWTECSPETAANFSAVAYFFGREIAADQHVPIGLIDSTWGGTPAEAWISLAGIASDSALMPVFAARAQMVAEQADLPYIEAAERREDETARSRNLPPPKHSWRPDPASWDPSWLFNGMVAPAVDFPIKGVIWYQGESNAGPMRAPLYEKVFRALISDWRSQWREGDFPFLFVQISSFKAGPGDDWPAVREAQRRSLALINTAMAVTLDAGEPENIHPADKQTVAHRLALSARAIAYGEAVEYSGPAYRQTSSNEEGLRVWFDHAAGGLNAKGGALQGFEIAGDDHKFVSATARVQGASVVVNSSQVARPKYVRYGWADLPAANLYNEAGLPASPFTSETAIPSR